MVMALNIEEYVRCDYIPEELTVLRAARLSAHKDKLPISYKLFTTAIILKYGKQYL